MSEITREVLELAALAAGRRIAIAPTGRDTFDAIDADTMTAWRPHTDPGEAARLAVQFRMLVDVEKTLVYATAQGAVRVNHDGSEAGVLRAWCEAVTLAAAVVGLLKRDGSS